MYILIRQHHWNGELHQLPEPVSYDADAEATEADYQSAMAEIGVAL